MIQNIVLFTSFIIIWKLQRADQFPADAHGGW